MAGVLEGALITSLENYILEAIEGSALPKTLTDDISKVVVMVMEWVESHLTTLLSTLGTVTSEMKHSAALTYLEQLFMKYIGKPISKEVKSLVSGFQTRIVESSKGLIAINGHHPRTVSAAPSVAPSVAEATVTTGTGTTTTAVTSLKKSGTLTRPKMFRR
jgi:hypothetical protein